MAKIYSTDTEEDYLPAERSLVSRIQDAGAGLSEQQLADYLGMEMAELQREALADPELYKAYKKSKADLILECVTSLRKAVRDGRAGAAEFVLRAQAGWEDKKEAEQKPIKIEVNIR